jgi:cytochrome subunit of sulfide dehydrogenase
MRIATIGAAVLLAAGVAVPAQAQDPNYARNIAATCTACHGTEGRSVGGVPPSLAGQSKGYLLQALKEFKEGKRAGTTIMHQHAKGYTDEQLDLIAGYFAGMKAGQGVAAPAAR